MRTIDELIEELKHTTSIRFASKKKDDKAVIRLDIMPDIMYYLREYRDSEKKTKRQRLIDDLREIRGENDKIS